MDDCQKPDLSFVVPCYGSGQILDFLCHLECSFEQAASSVTYEILFVCDSSAGFHSSINLKDYTKNKLHIHIVQAKNPGVSAARNYGLRKSKGQIVFLIDDDCRISKTFLSAALDLAQNNPNVLIGGSYFLDESSGVWAQTNSVIQKLWLQKGLLNSTQVTKNLLGGCLVMSRQVADKVFFDEKIIWGGEESEMIFELYQSYKIQSVFIEQLKLKHLDTTGFAKFLKRAWCQGYSANRDLTQPLLDSRWLKIIFSDLKILPVIAVFAVVSYFATVTSRSFRLFRKFKTLFAGKLISSKTSPAA